MKTVEVSAAPPESLVAEVRRLRRYFPYRICWGAFNPADPTQTETGANVDKRRFNKALRRPGFVGFIL